MRIILTAFPEVGTPIGPSQAGILLDPRDVSVVIDSATVVGETAFLGRVSTLVGRARGDVRFSDSAGNTGSCSVVSIHINAPPK